MRFFNFSFVLGALEDNDPLCIHIFKQAGKTLGSHVRAISSSVDEVSRWL